MATQSGSTQRVTVLLAGVGARSAPMLNDYLRKRGCEMALASSRKEVQRMRERHFDLVLSEFMLPDGNRTPAYAVPSRCRQPYFVSVSTNTAARGSMPFLKRQITRTSQACDPRGSESCWMKSSSIGICGMPRNTGADRERIGATTQPVGSQRMKEKCHA